MKIRLAGAQFFHADERTDRQTKLRVAFRNFANAPKNWHITVLQTVYCTLTEVFY